MKQPHLPYDVLSLQEQLQIADAFGLRNVSHTFSEACGEVVLNKVMFCEGKTIYDPYSSIALEANLADDQLLFKHPKETLTILEKERELSLWERMLPYPWGFLKGMHKKSSSMLFARPETFQKDWGVFFTLLDEIEMLLAGTEISALCISGNSSTASLVMRFVRRKCVGLAIDPTALSLQKRQMNGGLVSSNLFDLWGTSASFFSLKMRDLLDSSSSLNEINSDLKQALQQPESLLTYRIPTLEDGVIEMGL